MAKKPKGGRVTAPKESWPNMAAIAPTDPDEFWVWYRQLTAHPVVVCRPRRRPVLV